jgi:hypothetical protein
MKTPINYKKGWRKTAPFALQQGNLDGLCGIYSIINAVRKISKRRLQEVITTGLTRKEFTYLLKIALKWLKIELSITIKTMKYSRRKPLKLKNIWQGFEKHLSENTIIIIGFTGKHEHYSVITDITPKTLALFDSCKTQVIRKSQCSARYSENRYCIER